MFVWNDRGEIEVTDHIFREFFVIEEEEELEPEDDGYSFEETDYIFPDRAA